MRDHSHALARRRRLRRQRHPAWKYCLHERDGHGQRDERDQGACAGLGAASESFSHVHRVEQPARVGPIQAATLEHVIASSSGWHTYVGLLPLRPRRTAAAIITGAVAGRRNLLLLAQFNAVIVVDDVRGCLRRVRDGRRPGGGDPAATVVRVMCQIETPEEVDAKPSYLVHQLTSTTS